MVKYRHILLNLICLGFINKIESRDNFIFKKYENITNNKYFSNFWKSTGFCPLGSRGNISEYILSEDVKMNMVLIGAMPNKAIKYIRVHWLLDLLKIKDIDDTKTLILNFTDLDSFMHLLHSQKLLPIFELMGNPLIYPYNVSYFNNFMDINQKNQWYNMIIKLLFHYIDRYGLHYVRQWKFETWNEPDLKMYNTIPFTYTGYINYIQASKSALQEVQTQMNITKGFKLGGPAGLFKTKNRHKLCWGILNECKNSSFCPINFLSYHAKGDETTNGVIEKGLNIISKIQMEYPYTRNLPIANTEADVMTGWWKGREWRGDVRYAAMMVKILLDHINKMIIEKNISIKFLSNDNAFLNYHPYYFEQRTLFARFQLNNTKPRHIQFIKKPIYVASFLLSFLDHSYYSNFIKNGDMEIFETVSYKTHEYTVLGVAVNNTVEDSNKRNLFYKGLAINCNVDCKYVVYVLDNYKTNPYDIWKKHGSPSYPDKILRKKMRTVEGPFRYLPPTNGPKFKISFRYTLPFIFVLHACEKSNKLLGPVVDLQSYNVTQGEIILVWSDRKLNSRCIKTYEIEYLTESINSKISNQLFKRINDDDVIFLCYQHVPTDNITSGSYRVRAVDYWNRQGPYSSTIHIK